MIKLSSNKCYLCTQLIHLLDINIRLWYHDYGHMQIILSKSQFKPKALYYLREVEKKKIRLIITHQGKPVAQIIPFTKDQEDLLKVLKGSVIEFKDPTKPVAEESWESLA